METDIKTEVVIVGAGPTGLALACQFVRYGIDFVLIDKEEGITPYSRALGVQARTLEIYEQIGLAEALVAHGAQAQRARLIEGGTVRGVVELSDLGQGMSPYPFLLLVEQSKHEHLLYDFLSSHGKQVRWQTELSSVSQDETGVRAQVKTADGKTQTVEARYLVGCDGAKSFVRKALDIPFEGSTFERLFYVADVQIDWEFPHDAVQICLSPNTLTAFFPMLGENRYRIVGTFPETFSKDEGEILYEEIEKQVVEDTRLNLRISNVNWFSVYKVHSRRVSRFSEGRCFLAGDAAHIHTPAGAQGMNTGIQDSYNLAWKLALVLRGNANAKLLDSYNEERLANARHLLQTTDRAFDLGASEEPLLVFFRMHILPHIANFALHLDVVKQFIFPLISQIGIQYRDSALSEHQGEQGFKVKAGERMPYFQTEVGSVYDLLHAPKFHLLVFTEGKSENEAAFEALANDYTDMMDYHELPLQPLVTEWFGAQQPFFVLLRPDNYIGLIASGEAVESISAYLKALRSV